MFEQGKYYSAVWPSDVLMKVVAVVDTFEDRTLLRVRWVNMAGERPAPAGEGVVNVKTEDFKNYRERTMNGYGTTEIDS